MRAQVALERPLRGIDPVGGPDLLGVELPEGVRAGLKVILHHHLVVDFVLALDELPFCLLELQVEHVDVLRLGEVPAEVLFDQLDGVVDQIAICGVADDFFGVELALSEVLVQQRFGSVRPDRTVVPL